MRNFSLSRFLITLIIYLTLSPSISQANYDKKIPSAVIVGTVYCDTCFHQGFSKSSHFISGAAVVVECRDENSKSITFREESKTNEHGEFKVHLPTSISKHVKKIKACSVKLLSSNEPNCAVASSATSSSLHLKSRKEGTHIFSAGFFTFKPLQQPNVCNQKPSFTNSKNFNSMKSFTTTPPTNDPATSSPPKYELTPLPQLPKLPPLPELPSLPSLPKLPPWTGKTNNLAGETEKKNELLNQKTVPSNFFFPLPPFFPSPPPLIPLPPNPFQPPPLFPPNPFQPPPLFPPNPFQPPPSSIFPPIPLLNPPPPPPAFSFPPFPFPPGFPGIPPSPPSLKKKSP